MAIWKLTRPAFLGPGHIVRFSGNSGGVFEGEVIAPGLLVRVTAGPYPCLIGKQIQVRFGRVIAWQPLKAQLVVHA